MDDYRQAVALRGVDGLAEALISRHNRRMLNLVRLGEHLPPVVIPALTPLLPMDLALTELDASPERAPSEPGSSWPDHLAWGVDSAVAASRLLMSGQLVGAAVIARTQLERWNANRAYNASAAQAEGESTADWIDRVWAPGPPEGKAEASPAEQPGDGVDATLADDQPHVPAACTADPGSLGQAYAQMSEILHGRGNLLSVVHWEAAGLLEPADVEPQVGRFRSITHVVVQCLRQIRICLATLADDHDWPVLANIMRTVKDEMDDRVRIKGIGPFLFPLTPETGLSEGSARAVLEVADGYRRELARWRQGVEPSAPPEVWSSLAFAERRARAIDQGRRALAHEEKMLGADFDLSGIARTNAEAIFAAEMAGLLALWLNKADRRVQDAMAVASSALRSAVWLWLEDDVRAMGCLRTVLEQVARLRTWRLKPDTATRLEDRTATTPRDWVEAAGWRRLSMLNKALAEFAHGSPRARWWGARDVLVSLQMNESETAEFTGRTSALNDVTVFLQAECAYWLQHIEPEIGEAYWGLIRLSSDAVESGTESWLRHAWQNKDALAAKLAGPDESQAADLSKPE